MRFDIDCYTDRVDVQYPSASTSGKNRFSLASDASSSASNGILFSAEVIPTEAAKRDL
jgi:hypothetical protein